jgi:dTDP-4-amino-4,6-dideoxygalactose transaminase
LASDPIRSCSVPPSYEHLHAAARAIGSGVWVGGEETAGLEREFASWLPLDEPDRVVAVSSGTAALTALLRVHGIGPGDEVIIPNVTFTATGVAVLRAGARPVLVDVDETWTLSVPAVEDAMTIRTKAVIGVDFDGATPDWERLQLACPEPIITLLEDACPAYGARLRGRPAGLLGRDGAAFSLNESKQLPAGEGGLVIAPSREIAEKIRRMRHFGHAASGNCGEEAGADNWKITEVAAALGRAGIPRLRHHVMNSRLAGGIIRTALAQSKVLEPIPLTINCEPSWFRIRAVAPTAAAANRIAEALEEQGVTLQRSQEVLPLDRHPIFKGARFCPTPQSAELECTFCIGGRAKPIFDLDCAEAERWAEVITSLPYELVSPVTKEEL